MKTILLALVIAVLTSACYTTGRPISNDPSVNAEPICQPRFGLSGCYSQGSD